jgi:hypothetical protein
VLHLRKPFRQPTSAFGHGWQPQHKLCATLGVLAGAKRAAVALHRRIHADHLGFGWSKYYKKESGLLTFYLSCRHIVLAGRQRLRVLANGSILELQRIASQKSLVNFKFAAKPDVQSCPSVLA